MRTFAKTCLNKVIIQRTKAFMQNILRIKHKIYIVTMLRKTKHFRKPVWSYSKSLNNLSFHIY